MTDHKTIAIVGGGITGLTAAYYVQQTINNKQLPYKVTLIEASDRLGGKIHTIQQDDFIIERGADSFLGRKQPAVRLAENLGIEDKLVRNTTGQAYVLVNDTLHPMPKGSFMGIPIDLATFFETNLLTEKAKERIKQDLVISKSNVEGDQTLGAFFRYRFGDELVENLIEPLIAGVYSSDLDEMSLLATFPNFLELEQEYGSLIKGLQATVGDRKQRTGKTPGQFFTFKDGLETFIIHLQQAIENKVDIVHNQVRSITKKNDQYRIQLKQGEQMHADVVMMATPHDVIADVFSANNAFAPLQDIPVKSVANVALAFDDSAIDGELDGTGFVVSRNSPYRITACTWTHKKWQHTTPEGKVLLRAYVGKPSDQEVVMLSDEAIIDIVLQDLEKTMGITKEPEFAKVTRWSEQMPQYTVGHREKISDVRKEVAKSLPGVFMAGSSFDGVGIPDCIGQAEEMVEEAIDYLLGLNESIL